MRPCILLGMLIALIIVLSITIESNAQQKEWCIASPGASDAMLQEALDWACKNGADCSMFQPIRPCYLPDNLRHHASYAFNSYYQKFKKSGGTCDFHNCATTCLGDPSHGSCHFEYIP
ncbi:X8 domain [Dillenia turbinata]|uniref:X8 domain n=1 Tax=Dillenia turbinata TaxID=194707 RepID=A0AAN8V0M2_9MAGN